MTIDTVSMEQRILGYSYFPLFIDLESKMPVLAQDRTKHIKRTLHVGNYQMPILAQEPAQRKGSTKLISYRDYVELERLPTASVLLRVDHTTVDEKGRFVSINDKDRKAREQAYIPPPEYRSGEYSNAYYLLTEDERDLFALRKHRDIDRPLPELMKQICDASKHKYTDYNSMLGYFRKTYKASFAGVKPLDVNFFSRYEPDYGFRLEFGCIYGVKPFKDSIYQVLTSVCPPGVPYTGAPNKMVQAYKIQKVDWDKAYPEYFVFDEDEVSLKNVKLGFSSFVVFDIKRYNFETKESFDFGFAVLPMV